MFRTHALPVVVAFLLAIAGCEPALDWKPANTIVSSRAEVPIEFIRRGIPCIQFSDTAKPEQKCIAIIDTGAAGSLVSSTYADSRHLDRRAETKLEMTDAESESERSHYVVRVPSISIGGAQFENFDAIVDRSGRVRSPLDVVLGRPVFWHVLMTIDYPRSKLIFESGALPEPNGRDILHLRRDNRDNLLIPLTIAGRESWAILDTGVAGGGTPVSANRAAHLKWITPPVDAGKSRSWFSDVAIRAGRIDGDLQIGQYTIRRPIVTVTDKQDEDYIGADVLRHFAVTIDMHNERIRLSHPIMSNVIETPSLRRLALEFASSEQPIFKVTSGSLAAKAGLQSGDYLMTVDAIPINQLTAAKMAEIEEQRESVALHVIRNGQPIDVQLPLQVIVP